MKCYLVLLRNVSDKDVHSTICKDSDEIATLLTHLDKRSFIVEKIEVVEKFNSNYKEFCLKEPRLETGGNK